MDALLEIKACLRLLHQMVPSRPVGIVTVGQSGRAEQGAIS